MSQVLLRHQLGLLYTKEEKSLRIGHNTHKGGLQAFRPGAIWTYFLTQCSQPEPLLVALSHPVLGPPYLPEDFRYPGRKYVSALLETTDMDTALRSVSLPMERSTHTWLILAGRMGLAACLWFRIGLNLPSFLSD